MYLYCNDKIGNEFLYNIKHNYFIKLSDFQKIFLKEEEYPLFAINNRFNFMQNSRCADYLSSIQLFAISDVFRNYTNSPLDVISYSLNGLTSGAIPFNLFISDKHTLLSRLAYRLTTRDSRHDATIPFDRINFKTIKCG